jgi:hypothetical protein
MFSRASTCLGPLLPYYDVQNSKGKMAIDVSKNESVTSLLKSLMEKHELMDGSRQVTKSKFKRGLMKAKIGGNNIAAGNLRAARQKARRYGREEGRVETADGGVITVDAVKAKGVDEHLANEANNPEALSRPGSGARPGTGERPRTNLDDETTTLDASMLGAGNQIGGGLADLGLDLGTDDFGYQARR